MAKRLRSVSNLIKDRGCYIANKKSTKPETLKPVNRQARRAIKSGRKKNEQRNS